MGLRLMRSERVEDEPESWRRDLSNPETRNMIALPHPTPITLPIHLLTHMTDTSASALPALPRLRGRGKQSAIWVTLTVWPG